MKKQKMKLLVALALGVNLGYAQMITTVAGNGTNGWTGDGGAATAAELYTPGGVAIDGNIMYIADEGSHTIRKVAGGIITTIAGNGSAGYSGEGVPAGSSILNRPFNICVDNLHNIYFTEAGNHIVRKIDNSGYIWTIAGTPTSWCNGHSACGDGGPATSALLKNPEGIAVNSAGDIFIGDGGDYAVRRIDHTTGIISTIAGDPTHYSIGTTGDGGQATSALIAVDGITLDPAGVLYFASAWGNSVRKVDLNTGIISRVAGSYSAVGNTGDGGSALSALVDEPQGVMFDAVTKNLYVCDNYNRRVRVINTTTGIINAFAGTGTYGYTGDNGPALSATLKDPYTTAIDACGNIYISDWGAGTIRKVLNGTAAVFNASINSNTPVCAGSNIVATCSYSGHADSYSWQLQSCDATGHNTSTYSGPVISGTGDPATTFTFPNTTGIPCGSWYKITFIITKNCPVPVTSTVTKLIYVNCNPKVTISGTTNICNGSSTTLCLNTTTGSYNYNWTVGSLHYTSQCITVSPTSNTTYYGTVVNTSTGCQGSANVTVQVATNNPSFNLADVTTTCNYANIYALANNSATTSNPGYGYMYIVEELTSNLGATVWTQGNNPCYWWNFPYATYFSNLSNTPNDYTSSNTMPTACNGFIPGSSHTSEPYPDGKFAYGKPYRITLGSWITDLSTGNQVCPWAQSSQVIIPGCGTARQYTSTFEDHNAPDFSYLMKGSSSADVKANNDQNKDVLIYPNPSKGTFRVETGVEIAQRLELLDINGRVVLSREIVGSADIDAGHLAEGVYNLKLSSGEQVTNKRVVITK